MRVDDEATGEKEAQKKVSKKRVCTSCKMPLAKGEGDKFGMCDYCHEWSK